MNGQLSAVFAKLATLHAKNQFSFAIIVGDLFGDEAAHETHSNEISRLLAGQIEVPLTTYFALGPHTLPAAIEERLKADEEICPNLSFLGRRTTIKTADGLRIVALGGVHEVSSSAETKAIDEYAPRYNDTDAKILKGATNADILITSDWPKDVQVGSKISLATSEGFMERQSVAELCAKLKPRYHFSTADAFYEREPFFYAREDETAGYQTTRFLSLAPYGNPTKQKWIYAFTLDTKAALPTTPPAGATASPLQLSNIYKKRKANENFTRFDNQNGHSGHRSGKKSKRVPPAPSECFFCLSNPNVATHLITSIGDNAYLTTAKGPLSTASTFPALDFPGHMLIIPLDHSPSASAIAEADSRQATVHEMRRYRRALQRMLSERSKDRPEDERLGLATWEISRAGGIHFHQQCMPVSRSTIQKGLVEAAFKVQAQNDSYPQLESKRLSEAEEDSEDVEREDYFRAWIADCTGEDVQQLTLYLEHGFRFDLQFPRKVLARLLGLEGRMDWRDCGQGEAEETGDAEAFKRGFKEFDFTLE